MNLDATTILVLAGGIGTGAGACVIFVWRVVSSWRNGRQPVGPDDVPLSCGKADKTYVRKDLCGEARGAIRGKLDEVSADVKAIMTHHGVPPPARDADGRRV